MSRLGCSVHNTRRLATPSAGPCLVWGVEDPASCHPIVRGRRRREPRALIDVTGPGERCAQGDACRIPTTQPGTWGWVRVAAEVVGRQRGVSSNTVGRPRATQGRRVGEARVGGKWSPQDTTTDDMDTEHPNGDGIAFHEQVPGGRITAGLTTRAAAVDVARMGDAMHAPCSRRSRLRRALLSALAIDRLTRTRSMRRRPLPVPASPGACGWASRRGRCA